jgi:uncharacterized membrane protein YesL
MAWDTLMLALRLFWRRMGLLLTANLLWIGLSLLVVTWPAATAGLFALARRVADEELAADPQPATLADFWAGFREHKWRASLLALGDLAALVLIAVAMRFYGESEVVPLSWLVGPITLIGLAWAGAQLFLFPLLIQRDDRPPWAVAREAFLIAISYPLSNISLLVTWLVIAVAATALAGPILLVFFAFTAMLETVALRYVLAARGEMPLRMTPEQRDARARARPKQ